MNDLTSFTFTPSASTNTLAGDADAINAHAWVDLVDAVPDATRRELGLAHQAMRGGVHLVATGVDHLLLNRLLLAPPIAIPRAVGAYRSLGVSRFMLTFPEEVLPGAIALGEPLGLERFRRPWQTMVRDDGAGLPPVVVPAGVTLAPARSEDVRAMAALFCDAFDLPPHAGPIFASVVGREGWTVLVARDESEVVGVGIAYRRGIRAALVGGAVKKSHRRRGIQRALVVERVRQALDGGAWMVASETGVAVPGEPNPSEGNLRWAGLGPVGITEHLCPAGARWA